MKFTIKKKIAALSCLFLMILLPSILILLKNIAGITKSFKETVTITRGVIAGAHTLIKLVVDMETGQRGFIITGKEEFLEPYYKANEKFGKKLDDLKQSLSNTPEYLSYLEKIEHLRVKWIGNAGKPEIELRRKINESEVSLKSIAEMVHSAKGKAIIDNIRGVINTISADLKKSDRKDELILITQISKDIVDSETGVRGFLYAGEDKFLEPYYMGQYEFQKHTKEIKRLLKEDKSNLSRLSHIEKLYKKWLIKVAQPQIDARVKYEKAPVSMDEIAHLLGKGKGKAITDEIREVTAEFIAALEKDMEQTLSRSEKSAEVAKLVSIVVSVFGVFISIGLAVFLFRSIINPVNLLLNGTRRVAEGSLNETIEVVSEDELGMLASSFNRMTEDLRRSRDEIVWAKEYTENIIKSIGDGVISTDSNGKVLLVNKVAEELTGWIQEEAAGKPLSQIFRIINEKTREPAENPVEKVLESGAVVTLANDTVLISRNGREMIITDSAAPIKNMEGKILGTVLVFRDFTERKHLESQLEIFKKFAESSEQGFGIALLNKKIIYTNNALLRILGEKSLDDVKDNSFSKYYNKKSLKKIDDEVIPILMKEGYWTGELELITVDGRTIPTLENLFVIKDMDGTPLYLADTITDFTERKKLENELIEARERAMEASRLKSEFLANMSHEIRTPLNGIVGMTELLEDTELTGDQRRYINMVNSSADSLMNVINDILDFSKIEAGRLDLDNIDFKLRDSIGDTLKILAHRAHGKGLELAYKVSSEAPELITGDPGRLRQIIINLVGNAIKFTDKGEVVINVEVKSQTDNEALLHFLIRDTGVGIPTEKIEKIFDPFTQVDGSITRQYGGTGLGLAISGELIKMMGGEIWVESEEGKGSIFHFTARFQIQKKPQTESLPSESVSTKGISVLVVDDNETNRLILKEMLEKWEIIPTVVESAFEAIKAIEAQRTRKSEFDLIISDIHMPELNGFALIEKIKESQKEDLCPIILLTSAGMRGDAEKCRELGISAYLMKPIKQSEMLDTIMTIFGRKRLREEKHLVTRHKLREERESLNILIAEDNIINQEAIKRMLERHGHRITIANNGSEVLLFLGKSRFDLILMDVQMPEMDGFQTTGVIRDPGSHVKDHNIYIVAMTAHAMKGDREKCLEAGMDDYIAKPIRRDALFEVLDRIGRRENSSTASSTRPETLIGKVKGDEKKEAVVFDKKATINRVEGDMDDLKDLITLFLERCPEIESEIENSINKGDMKELGKKAHSLKGTVGLFFADRTKEAAIQIEESAKSGESEKVKRAYEKLKKEMDMLKVALGEMIG